MEWYKMDDWKLTIFLHTTFHGPFYTTPLNFTWYFFGISFLNFDNIGQIGFELFDTNKWTNLQIFSVFNI